MTTEIENNVAPPEPKAKPRARRKKVESVHPAASLIKALKFISLAQRKAGTIGQQHCIISGNWAAATNGILTIGAKIEEDLVACPHTFQFIDGLSKCGHDLNITQLSQFTLSIKSEKFKAIIPCATVNEIELTAPDAPCAVIDDRIRAALENVAMLAVEGAENAIHAAVLLQAQTAVGFNGFAILEYWHGIDLPPNLLLPKSSVNAILKTDKKLTAFGYSQSSATFYFEDESFIKTQLFADRYPAYQNAFDEDIEVWALPDEFFKAVGAIESFSPNGSIHFKNGFIYSHAFESEASSYQIEGLPEGLSFNAKYLLMLEHAIKKVFFNPEERKLYFYGENIRGVLTGLGNAKEPAPKKHSEMTKEDFDKLDNDMPF